MAENATKKSITTMEERMAGTTEQLEKLSSKTIDGLALALQSVGESKVKAEEINKDIVNLKEIKLDKVKAIVDILVKSTDQIKALIGASETSDHTKLKSLLSLRQNLQIQQCGTK